MAQNAVAYIKKRFSQGISQSQIVEELKGAGWKIPDINISLAEAQGIILTPKLQSPSATLVEAWKFYRRNIQLFLPIILVPSAVNLLPYIFLLFRGDGTSLEEVIASEFFSNPWQTGAILAAWFLALILASLWAQISLVFMLLRPREVKTGGESMRKSMQYLPSFLWLGLLNTFFLVGGFFFFVVPGIIFSVWVTFSNYILLDQNIRGISAVKKSREYARGYEWALLGRIFFLTLLLSVAGMILGFSLALIFLLLAALLKPLGISRDVTSIISEALTTIGSYIFLPFSFTYFFLLYENIKAIKQNEEEKSETSLGIMALFAALGYLILGGVIALIIFLVPKITALSSPDIFIIQPSLKVYYKENGRYPKNLSELAPKYIETLPKSFAQPQNFTYTPAADGKSYKLCILVTGGVKNCIEK